MFFFFSIFFFLSIFVWIDELKPIHTALFLYRRCSNSIYCWRYWFSPVKVVSCGINESMIVFVMESIWDQAKHTHTHTHTCINIYNLWFYLFKKIIFVCFVFRWSGSIVFHRRCNVLIVNLTRRKSNMRLFNLWPSDMKCVCCAAALGKFRWLSRAGSQYAALTNISG